jgi:formamidopyrimidine-DNA glycosylase
MPELPEVETTARGLRPRLIGQRIVGVRGVDWPRMLPNTSEEEMNAILSDQRILAVERRGKYLLLHIEDGLTVAVHRKMSGNLLLAPAEAAMEKHTHFVLALEGGAEVRFVDTRKFGRVYLFRSPEELQMFVEERLGPEPLVLDAAVLADRLKGRRGRLKPLLLDQAFLAGIGNLYADEALWEARLHPLRSAETLSRREMSRLAEAISIVLQRGIERRGTSFSTYRDADGEPGENQDHLLVYGREGEPCPRCGRPIQRIVIAQRSAHLCPKCQRESVRRRGASGSGSLI